jgi:hypothetical protein
MKYKKIGLLSLSLPIKNFYQVLFLCCIIAFSRIGYVVNYSENFAFSTIRSVDDYEFALSVSRFAGEFWHSPSHAYANVIDWGYGPLYWLISAVFAFPGLVIGSEQATIIGLRLLSLLAEYSSLYLILSTIKKYIVASIWLNFAIAILFFSQTAFHMAVRIHPETLYCFLLTLAYCFLIRDGGLRGPCWIKSTFFYIAASGVKLLAFPFGVVYLVYEWSFRKDKSIYSLFSRAAIFLGLALVINLPFFLGDNFLLFYAAVRARSKDVRKGFIPESGMGLWNDLVFKFNDFSFEYLNLFFLAVAIFMAVLIVIFNKNQPKLMRFIVSSSLLVVAFYTLFCIAVANKSASYGIALIYFLPYLLGAIIYSMQDRSAVRASFLGSIIFFGILLGGINGYLKTLEQVFNPKGGARQHEQSAAIEKSIEVVQAYSSKTPLQLGTSHDIAVPSQDGFGIIQERMWVLSPKIIEPKRLLIFWKGDFYRNKLWLTEVEGFSETRRTYTAIVSGEKMEANGRIFSYFKVCDNSLLECFHQK